MIPAVPADPPPESALAIRRLCFVDGACPDVAEQAGESLVFDAPGVESIVAEYAGVVLPVGDEVRVATLLAGGAPCVYLGEAALLDSTVVERLVARHGGECIGIHAPLRRQTVSWSFETVSNADFKVVTPSLCAPGWEVLRADGTTTGTLAHWWLKAMRELGIGQFLVRVDIGDDTDLNLCADLVETLGTSLWLGPLTDRAPRLWQWHRYGQAFQLALPDGVHDRLAELMIPDSETELAA